jgi:hypothetical protein
LLLDHGVSDVVSREGADRLHRRPSREHEELDLIGAVPPQQHGALEALHFLKLRQHVAPEVLDVEAGARRRGRAMI